VRKKLVINGIKLIRRKLTLNQSIKVVTAQAMSLLYYGSVFWLTPSLSQKNMNLVERIHYKALRLVVKDYKQRMSRDWIDCTTKRLPPRLWMKFNAASYFLKLFYGLDHQLKASKLTNTYIKRRNSGLLFGYDTSKSKIGRQITKNWIGGIID